ncbi:hypothetical protein CesoFtcFv8_000007 [Champsocephalus esox]|uniref:Uncharacterized protein n=1 Tax=Champsocephalus esox TaxID=159716 RepID=A0AAN8E372_9TELE|nr:hypothetical protein CesoFtcFv8_000007 [Champsocephalus esox]
MMRLQQGLSPQYPQPNITHGLEEATEPTEKRGRRFVLPERGGKPAGASASVGRVESLGFLYAATKACVAFSEPPYFDMNHYTFSIVQF